MNQTYSAHLHDHVDVIPKDVVRRSMNHLLTLLLVVDAISSPTGPLSTSAGSHNNPGYSYSWQAA